jgi:hypothetical protein
MYLGLAHVLQCVLDHAHDKCSYILEKPTMTFRKAWWIVCADAMSILSLAVLRWLAWLDPTGW